MSGTNDPTGSGRRRARRVLRAAAVLTATAAAGVIAFAVPANAATSDTAATPSVSAVSLPSGHAGGMHSMSDWSW